MWLLETPQVDFVIIWNCNGGRNCTSCYDANEATGRCLRISAVLLPVVVGLSVVVSHKFHPSHKRDYVVSCKPDMMWAHLLAARMSLTCLEVFQGLCGPSVPFPESLFKIGAKKCWSAFSLEPLSCTLGYSRCSLFLLLRNSVDWSNLTSLRTCLDCVSQCWQYGVVYSHCRFISSGGSISSQAKVIL